MPIGQQKKRILLCVTGLSPQIVTETLYALAAQPCATAAFVPDEIHVITTLEGRRRVQLALLASPNTGGYGYLARLCQEYGIDRNAIRFDESTVHVIHDANGNELADITDDASNRAAADFILGCVRNLCADNDTDLHVSMAGGRKTMGFFLGYALSLYGRPQDRLSHVLVNAPFESHPDFFYPPNPPRALTLPSRNEIVSTADARILLADIPFVRLREGLDPRLLKGDLPYSEVVARAQTAIGEPKLELDFTRDIVRAAEQQLHLSEAQKLWLYWFARRALKRQKPIHFSEADVPDLRRACVELHGEGRNHLLDHIDKAIADLTRTGDRNYFEHNRSRLNKALRDQLGPSAAKAYEIAAVGRRPHTAYQLLLTRKQIRISL